MKLITFSLVGINMVVFAFSPGRAQSPPSRPQPPGNGTAAQQTPEKALFDLSGDPLPPGVIARLGTLNLRAVGARTALSSDGKTIISVSGRQVKYWDAQTGKLREQRNLSVSPRSAGIGDMMYLSSDGKFLAIREDDFDIPVEIWDIASAKRINRLALPEKEFYRGAVFSPDGKTVAVKIDGPAPDRGIVRLWEVGGGERQVLKGHKKRSVSGVAFSADGKLVATADGESVVCWGAIDGRQIWRVNNSAEVLTFTPDNGTLIGAPSLTGRSWQCWDAATGKRDESRKMPEGHGCNGLAIAPDNWTLAFSLYIGIQGVDARVRVWDMRTGTMVRTLPTIGAITSFAPDGRSIHTNDGTLQRWELTTGRPLLPDHNSAGHRAEIFKVVYSGDGRLLATSAVDGTIRLWDRATTKTLQIMRTTKKYDHINLAFTSDAARLISGDTDGDLHVWDTATGKELRRITLHDEELGEKKQHVHRLHLTPDDKTAVVLGNDPGGRPIPFRGTVSSWDLATGRRSTFAKIERSETYYTAFSPDGLTLASGGQLIDVTSGNTRVKLDDATGNFGHYAYSPDGRLVAGLIKRSIKEGNRLYTKPEGSRIWDAASGRAVAHLNTDRVGQYAFTPDARYLATADDDGIRLWEVLTGTVVLKHQAHERRRGSFGASFASCLTMAPDGRSLATGHPDGTILVWGMIPPGREINADNLPRLLADLSSKDAAKAYDASWQMTYAADLALPFLRMQIKPATAAPSEQTKPLLADLDSQDFKKREESARGLRALGERAAAAMRETLNANPSLETRRRVEGLLKELELPPVGKPLGAVRAVTVVERIGTREACTLIDMLASGDSGAHLTKEAKLSLKRLAKRLGP